MSPARAAKTGGEPALGIIGGSGLYEIEGIEESVTFPLPKSIAHP